MHVIAKKPTCACKIRELSETAAMLEEATRRERCSCDLHYCSCTERIEGSGTIEKAVGTRPGGITPARRQQEGVTHGNGGLEEFGYEQRELAQASEESRGP
jgi:hypothetical protein